MVKGTFEVSCSNSIWLSRIQRMVSRELLTGYPHRSLHAEHRIQFKLFVSSVCADGVGCTKIHKSYPIILGLTEKIGYPSQLSPWMSLNGRETTSLIHQPVGVWLSKQCLSSAMVVDKLSALTDHSGILWGTICCSPLRGLVYPINPLIMCALFCPPWFTSSGNKIQLSCHVSSDEFYFNQCSHLRYSRLNILGLS